MEILFWTFGTIAWLAMGYALAESVKSVFPKENLSAIPLHIISQITWPFWLLYGLARRIWL